MAFFREFNIFFKPMANPYINIVFLKYTTAFRISKSDKRWIREKFCYGALPKCNRLMQMMFIYRPKVIL